MTTPIPAASGLTHASEPGEIPLTKGAVRLFAFACGLTTANVYYAQSIAGPIARDLHLPASLAGFIVTSTQLGYGIGLFFLVCLADLVENRRLILLTTFGTIISLLALAGSRSADTYLLASFLLGAFTVGSQILLPLAVHLSPERLRGQVIGNIMGGLVTGIMLSRPVSSLLAAHWGWRSVFIFSAIAMFSVLCVLGRMLPSYRPSPDRGYFATLRSILWLLATSRTLLRRAFYQGTLFAVFNLFWTGVPLMLHTRYGIGQTGIALFALAGAAGAFSAPLAGKAADRGHSSLVTGCALLCAATAMLISGFAQVIGSVTMLVGAAIILDAATQANQVVGQRIVQGLDAAARGRLNAAYMTVIFMCGAIGSALGSITYFHGGWWATAGLGSAMAVAIFLIFMTEKRA